MRFIAFLTGLFLALPAQAEVDLGAMISETGLAATVDSLGAIAEPSGSEAFALSASQFLRAIERNFQTRYAYGLGDVDPDIPGLSIGLPDNPAPQPFEGAIINRIFEDMAADMELVRQTLPEDAPDAAVMMAPGDLWFDINANGTREPEEGFYQTVLTALTSPRRAGELEAMTEGQEKPIPPIRFDASDVHWLRAYTHLLTATADFVLAFDPASSIDRVLGAESRIFADQPMARNMFLNDETINLIAIVIATLRTDPDPARTQSAQQNFLAMMDANLAFWAAVAAETDDEAEWIPNANQTGALPFVFGPEIAEGWQQVLAETRAILTGELLLPHPRIDPAIAGSMGRGIDLSAWLQDPAPIDIVSYAHGHGLEAYFRDGRIADFGSVQRFQSMTGRNFSLFSILLN